MAHAFSFHFGRRFGGACGPNWYPGNHEAQRRLIELLGLGDELPILDDCPGDNGTSAGAAVLNRLYDTGMPPFYYLWKDTGVWTDEWLDYVQKKRKGPPPRPGPSSNSSGGGGGGGGPFVAVHIRRGDVDPCDNYTADRYLPNSHYLSLLDEYRTERHGRVVVHSESKSREPWSDFDNVRGIELKLDGDPLDAVRDMLAADVLILSKSSFSLVAALFAGRAATVVHTESGHRPRPGWKAAGPDLTARSRERAREIREHCAEYFSTY
jgi:hypothetical protein